MRLRYIRLFILIAALGDWAPLTNAQSTWYVDAVAAPFGNGTQASPYYSIQYAIEQPTTLDGDTVEVAPGTYWENVDFLGKAITVHGTGGAAVTTIDANYNGSAVSFDHLEGPGSVLDGFTLTHGKGTPPTWGGGIYCVGCTPTIRHCSISNNGLPPPPCGAPWPFTVGIVGDAVIDDCAITGNLGGGVLGNATATNCIVQWNTSTEMTHAAGVSGGTWTNCTIIDNRAWYPDCTGYNFYGWSGGALNATLDSCTIAGNEGGHGPGGASSCVLVNCQISDNTVLGSSNGLAVGAGAGGSQLTGCVVKNNSIPPASSIGAGGGLGGGIFNCTAALCEIVGNTANAGGGVLGGTCTNCTIRDNHARFDAGSLSTSNKGGGVFRATLLRCEVTGNSTDAGGDGGGMYLDSPESAVNCTIYGNTAGIGAGVYNAQAAQVRNCIVWANTPDQAPGGGVTYSDVQGGALGTGNISLDPRLLDPAHHVFALRPGSPCINAGDPTSPLDPDGTIADMGAHPFDPLPITYCVAKTNSLGCVPTIGATGTASQSGPDDFYVVASNVLNQKSGMFLWSGTPGNAPLFGGTLCLSSPIIRTPIQNSGGSLAPANDCSGAYSFFFSHAYMTQAFLLPGSEVCAQFWSRDPGFAAPNKIGLTDALHFVVLP